MHLCPVSEIHIRQNRNRKIFTEAQIQNLADSIASDTGLIQLPVVRLNADGSRELLAGERRLRAMQLLWASGKTFHYMKEPIASGSFPHALITEVDLLTSRTIEVEENIQRVDLSWQEKVQALAELHALRKEQNPTQTLGDTGQEVGYSGPSSGRLVKDAIILTKYLADPDIAKAKTQGEAMKKLSRKIELEFRAGVSLQGLMEPGNTKHSFQRGDMLDLISKLPPSYFDVILTDPPYGINAETFRANMSTLHKYDDSWDETEHKLIVLATEGFRVARPQAHLYVFCDVLMFLALRDIFNDAGWSVWPRPFIWIKDVGHIPNANLGPQHRYECILYANKGDKPVTSLQPDVIIVPAVNDKFHAAQKPVDLYLNLLRRSTIGGDKVLDPFCGTGTIFEAAQKCGCFATGFELDEATAQFAQERLMAL